MKQHIPSTHGAKLLQLLTARVIQENMIMIASDVQKLLMMATELKRNTPIMALDKLKKYYIL